MLLFFQVFFIILSAVFATAFFFVGIWLSWNWAVICAILAVVCYFLSMTFKNTLALRNPQTTDEETTKKDE